MQKNIEADALECFLKHFLSIKKNYRKIPNSKSLLDEIKDICIRYNNYFGIGDLILAYGEELISEGDSCTGYAIFQTIDKEFHCIANQTLLYIRLAEFEFLNGNLNAGKEYLLTLCKRVDNLEETIKINELSEVWEQYKYLVLEQLPQDKNSSTPLSVDECTMGIEDIIKLPGDELLFELSEHLSELSGNGSCLGFLTEQERNVYFIDEFIEVLNSDGLENYFSNHNDHFHLLLDALKAVGCTEAIELGQKIMSKLTERDIAKFETDFEKEESFYYKKVEKKLLHFICCYVRENLDAFR